jgi:hypothetical protein
MTKNTHQQTLVKRLRRELSGAYVYDAMTPAKLTRTICSRPGSHITRATVDRFFNHGYGNGKHVYTRGPYATTLAGIADGLGLELALTRRPQRRAVTSRNAK